MSPDIDPNQQTALLDPVAVRNRLRHLLPLLGVSVNVENTTFGVNPAIAFSPMWVGDANKLALALEQVSEVQPYLAHNTPAAAKDATTR
jgi:hypothetical protein